MLAAQRKWKSLRQFKRLRVYAHETVVKAFANLDIALSSIQAIKTAALFCNEMSHKYYFNPPLRSLCVKRILFFASLSHVRLVVLG